MPETRIVAIPEPSRLPRRRRMLSHLLALPLAGLAAAPGIARATGLPEVPAGPGSSSARAHLLDSATAHGLLAWRQRRDINASFSSAWAPASGWSAAESGAAAAVQMRLLVQADLLAVRQGRDSASLGLLRRQAGFGPAASAGTPVPTSVPASIPVPVPVPVPQAAPADDPLAVLSADALCLLLLGPLAVLDRTTAVNWGPPDTLDGRRCDQLVLTVAPGLGLASESRMALFIDRDVGWLRRLRWAGDNPGAGWLGLAEVDFFDHFSLHGMVWPRRFQSPSRWWLPGARPQTGRLTGLDLDRGYSADALAGERWTGEAAAPARPLPPG